MPATVPRPARADRPSRSLAAKLAIAAEAAFVAVVAFVLLTSGGRSDPSRQVLAREFAIPPGPASGGVVVGDRSRAMQRMLESAGEWNFAALQGTSEHECARGDLDGVSDCTWNDADGARRQGRFTIVDRELARVSDGGTGPRPRSATEATEVVDAVLAHRGADARAACTRLSGDRRDGVPIPLPPGAYDCLLPGGGAHRTLRWEWNPDGTVARETYGTPHRR